MAAMSFVFLPKWGVYLPPMVPALGFIVILIGTILGSLFGVFIPVVLQNGFVIVGIQPFWQQVAVGGVLIGAVYLDQVRRARYRQ